MKTKQLVCLSALSALLSACGGGGGGSDTALTEAEDNTVVADFSIAYVKRAVEAVGNPTDGQRFAAGGDLFIRDLASAAASEHNVTADHTQGQGDVADVEVSYDGSKLLFSMRTPGSTWNIWEYDVESRAMQRLISDDAVAAEGDDVDPAYLPDGRIVFSSNRQTRSLQQQAEQGIAEPYKYRDEYEREATIVLHVMEADGSNIRQISHNQSHDRNPTVLSSGEVMYARWDHLGNRNHFPLFTMNPDGSNMFVLYGAFSGVNSFLHPREMPNGKIMSTAMPLSRTHEGGALMEIDVAYFSENNERAPVDIDSPDYDPNLVPPEDAEGQRQITFNRINTGRGVSEGGRYTTPYPLWDGTNRALVSWSPTQPLEDEAANPMEAEEGPPVYGLYMLDLDDKSQVPIVLPAIDSGIAIVDGVAIHPRPLPNRIADKDFSGALKDREMAILNVKSVYDTDTQDLMGTSMLIGGEGIPQTTVQTDEGPQQVADIRALKDPTSAFRQSSGQRRPAYFLRVSKAVPTPPGMNRDVISENNMEMQQLLGYVPVEPDGSVKAEVPADTALAISVVDADGRALQVHTNWLHFLPGERRTCNGCHSPRRGSAINAAPIAGDHANTTMAGQEVSGESMAETRTRLNPAVLQLSADMVFDDIWTPAASGVTPEASIQIDYAGLTTPAPRDGVINYEEVIQPLWDKACVSCHGGASPAAELDLTSSLSGNGRLLSYNELMIGDPVLGADGLPVIRERDGELEVEREDPLIDTGSARDGSRASYFAEVLFARELRHPELLAPGIATTHGGLLNASELRLVAEWIDLGAQYYNSPFARAASNPDGSLGPLLLDQFRAVPPRLSEADFESDVHPVLMNRCAGCHQPRGNDSAGFETSNFVLTGSLEGDYNMALGMVNNVMDPAASMLLARPASDNSDLSLLHPQIELEDGSQVPVLSASADDDGNNSFGDYTVIFNWINAVN